MSEGCCIMCRLRFMHKCLPKGKDEWVMLEQQCWGPCHVLLGAPLRSMAHALSQCLPTDYWRGWQLGCPSWGSGMVGGDCLILHPPRRHLHPQCLLLGPTGRDSCHLQGTAGLVDEGGSWWGNVSAKRAFAHTLFHKTTFFSWRCWPNSYATRIESRVTTLYISWSLRTTRSRVYGIQKNSLLYYMEYLRFCEISSSKEQAVATICLTNVGEYQRFLHLPLPSTL